MAVPTLSDTESFSDFYATMRVFGTSTDLPTLIAAHEIAGKINSTMKAALGENPQPVPQAAAPIGKHEREEDVTSQASKKVHLTQKEEVDLPLNKMELDEVMNVSVEKAKRLIRQFFATPSEHTKTNSLSEEALKAELQKTVEAGSLKLSIEKLKTVAEFVLDPDEDKFKELQQKSIHTVLNYTPQPYTLPKTGLVKQVYERRNYLEKYKVLLLLRTALNQMIKSGVIKQVLRHYSYIGQSGPLRQQP